MSGPSQSPSLSPTYKVTVTKDYLVFASGHFITFDGDHCERIHGHNFRAVVEVEDILDENHYVFDFIALLEMSREIVQSLDHMMLLPTQSPYLILEDDGPDHVRIRYKDRRWGFPRTDCVLLPMPNTTSELLAHYIGVQLQERMKAKSRSLPKILRVEVEENFGQSALVQFVCNTNIDQ